LVMARNPKFRPSTTIRKNTGNSKTCNPRLNSILRQIRERDSTFKTRQTQEKGEGDMPRLKIKGNAGTVATSALNCK